MHPGGLTYKICPSCQAQAALHAPFCTSCGHQFRTVFAAQPNLNQTQAFGPAGTGARQGFLTPKDETEWKVAAFWLWAILAVCILAVYAGTRVFGFDVLAILFFGLIATACGVGLRRLYVYVNYGQRSPLLTFFCVVGFVALLIFVNEYAAAQEAKERQSSGWERIYNERYGQQSGRR